MKMSPHHSDMILFVCLACQTGVVFSISFLRGLFNDFRQNAHWLLLLFLLETMDVERVFSAEQIKIPEELGDVLKQYTKAVIRAQPKDLLAWSAQCVLLLLLSHRQQHDQGN
jgi:hypothetical protein